MSGTYTAVPEYWQAAQRVVKSSATRENGLNRIESPEKRDFGFEVGRLIVHLPMQALHSPVLLENVPAIVKGDGRSVKPHRFGKFRASAKISVHGCGPAAGGSGELAMVHENSRRGVISSDCAGAVFTRQDTPAGE